MMPLALAYLAHRANHGYGQRVSTCRLHGRGLKRFCSVQEGRPQAYADIPRTADAAMDKIGQIPQGHENGFDLERTGPWT
jgi:hypothetical protein